MNPDMYLIHQQYTYFEVGNCLYETIIIPAALPVFFFQNILNFLLFLFYSGVRPLVNHYASNKHAVHLGTETKKISTWNCQLGHFA